MSTTIEFDATAVRSRVVRRQIEGALERLALRRHDDIWRSLRLRGRGAAGGRAVLIGDLHEAVGAGGLDALVGGPSSLAYVLLVRTTLDARLRRRPDIALGLNDERFFVLELRDEAAGGAAMRAALLSEYFRALVERLQPDRVRSARFSVEDGVLWLEFGDGLRRAVKWAALPFATKLLFAPVNAVAREHGQAVLLTGADGSEHDIDAGALRSAVDPVHASSAARRHAAERASAGARLRRMRESLGLSQEEVARRSGVPQESLSRIENGHRDPRLDTLRKLAAALGMDVAALLAAIAAD
ncbi:MAG: helix-turn-helix transcriptional regulator [Thermoleophilia bacterium]|jgi:DNA-binding XRE family transcriptional regulator|nr:helix-turn-helix transcriptional regulator [Thermoleophilia bacterium]